MTREEAEAEAERARDVGWAVTADESGVGWWLRCDAADGLVPRFATSKADLQAFIVGGAVARRSAGTPRDVVTVPGPLLRQVVELLISLGDHVGNVDSRTGIDRCAVVGELRKLLRGAVVTEREPLTPWEQGIETAKARGHQLVNDPTHSLSNIVRATCSECGRSVLGNGRAAYGSALEIDCAEARSKP